MELAPEKRQLRSQQRDERAEIHGALKQLEAEFSKDLERIRRQVRKKSFIQEITWARRYHEGKSVWEYLNNIVESIHGFTWERTATAICITEYQQKRSVLERELRELDSQHRKERIILRYDCPVESGVHGQDNQSSDLHCTVP